MLLDEVMMFFFKHLSLSALITNDSVERKEQWEFPSIALREAVVNAICHRETINVLVVLSVLQSMMTV